MTPHDVFLEAHKRGLQLAAAGDNLAVMPKGACPPDFAAVLREHKSALLHWLNIRLAPVGRQSRLTPCPSFPLNRARHTTTVSE